MKWENCDINVVEWVNIPKFPLLLNGDQEKALFLRLMECLTPVVNFDIFMDNCFTSLRLLTLLGVSNIQATHVLNKNRTAQKKKKNKKVRGHFEQRTSAHQEKKQYNFDSGWLKRQQCDLQCFF